MKIFPWNFVFIVYKWICKDPMSFKKFIKKLCLLDLYTHCDQSLLFFHLINQRFIFALVHNSKSVQNIKERNIMSETGFKPVQEEKAHFLVRHSNDWAILSCFIFFSILKDLRTMQKYGGKIYQWCLKQRKWNHGLWNVSFHKRWFFEVWCLLAI